MIKVSSIASTLVGKLARIERERERERERREKKFTFTVLKRLAEKSCEEASPLEEFLHQSFEREGVICNLDSFDWECCYLHLTLAILYVHRLNLNANCTELLL